MAEITSVGKAGVVDWDRSNGRAYLTLDHTVNAPSDLLAQWSSLTQRAQELGRRRTVLRATCSPAVEIALRNTGIEPSVRLPLSKIGLGNNSVLIIEQNEHISDVPEWPEVYSYWKGESKYLPPHEQIKNLPEGFHLTNRLTENDIEDLFELWRPFGWSKQGIVHFIQTHTERPEIWFSAIRDNRGKIASACMGEALTFNGVYMVEATEFGTKTEYRGHNLCTASVVGLIAQIVQTTLYFHNRMPLIISEFNMSSRSDVVGRKAGMTIPGVEGVVELAEPVQVLRRNVAVLDGCLPNEIKFSQFTPEYQNKFRDSFRNPHRYWRNFIVGMLTQESINSNYSPEQIEKIMSRFIN